MSERYSESETFMQNLEKHIRELSKRYTVRENYCNFMEALAIMFSNVVRTEKYEEREKRFDKIMSSFDENKALMATSFLIKWYSNRSSDPKDYLGPFHTHIGMDYSGTGQFFTPWHVSKFMAECMLGSKENIESTIRKKGYLSIQDPTCGAGGMLVAAANVLGSRGVDYRNSVLFNGTEIVMTTAHTCFVQCALYGLPAVITHGDSLAMKDYDTFVTPNGWKLINSNDQKEAG